MKPIQAFRLCCLALCSLGAIVAPAAHANWLVEGATLAHDEPLAISAHTTHKLIVEKKNLEIQCTTVKSSGFKLVASSGTAEGIMSFTGCTTFSPPGSGKVSTNCKPKEPLSDGMKVLVILHSGKNYLLSEPATSGGKFMAIEFSELCALTETSDLTGEEVLECGKLEPAGVFVGEDCNVSRATHLMRYAPEALFEGNLQFGPSLAKSDGIFAVSLAGV
ncbi:MAG TPA: hypothetical protein VJQ84_06365, partial [Solirubrobacterales bacterium]|nr:hypothetical protein [Solirubrobacterales bacterium]